jgi:HEAT repeat protein
MAAAISREDAAKKVDADGMTDGKWDLDKLWKLVTAWEVGDNTVVMPIAREKFVALGRPALDRALSHLDAKDSLLTRAIQKTLEAFPRDEWIGTLIHKTTDPDKLVRKNAVLMVKELKVTEALPRLTEMLTTDPDTQGGVLAALASMKTAPPEVAALLKAPKEPVAVQAAVCLGAVGDDPAIAALIDALGPDYAFPVRLAAVGRLAALGERAVEPMWAVAVKAGPAPTMQTRNIVKALGASKCWQAVSHVNAATRWNDEPHDKWIRLSAILALPELLDSLPAPETLPEEAQASIRLARIDLANARAAETDPLLKRILVKGGK